MKKLLFAFSAIACFIAADANAQSLSKGAVQRLNLDSITLDGTTVTATGAELNILDGVTATATEINNAADISENSEVVTATNVLTTDECGKTMSLNSATEFVTTLPAETLGCKFKFVVAAAPASASYTVITDGDETIVGTAFDATGAAVEAGAGVAAADTISFVDGTSIVGDSVELWSDGTKWYGTAFSSASGAITFTSAF